MVALAYNYAFSNGVTLHNSPFTYRFLFTLLLLSILQNLKGKMNLSSLTLYAGTKWSWKEAPTGFLPPTYSLKIYLKLKNNPPIELTSTVSGSEFLFSIGSDITNITPGNYQYQAQAFDSQGNMYFIESGTIAILPNLAIDVDTRDYWEQIADEAKAAYKTLVSQTAASITLSNGKQITFANRSELLKIIHNAEVKAGIKSSKTRVLAKFINPTEIGNV